MYENVQNRDAIRKPQDAELCWCSVHHKSFWGLSRDVVGIDIFTPSLITSELNIILIFLICKVCAVCLFCGGECWRRWMYGACLPHCKLVQWPVWCLATSSCPAAEYSPIWQSVHKCNEPHISGVRTACTEVQLPRSYGMLCSFEQATYKVYFYTLQPESLTLKQLQCNIFIYCNWVVTRWQWLFYM